MSYQICIRDLMLSSMEYEILVILSEVKKEKYGMEIMNTMNEVRNKFFINPITIGSLYPTLRRMLDAGLVFRKDGFADSTTCTYYSIAPKGKLAIEYRNSYIAALTTIASN